MDNFNRFYRVIFVVALAILFLFTRPHNLNVSAESPVLKLASQEAATVLYELMQRLKSTELINGDLTHERLNLVIAPRPRWRTKEFITLDPYTPRYKQFFENVTELKYPIPNTVELYELNEKKARSYFEVRNRW
ncbi:MAG: hypothetical protein F4227_04775 [Gammaproteobacteria bacterium]|nr:hypothetical protein [Gammaproteobacteria bacterium]MYF02283.1 hypothetical protein [Gammaproteobacteria bacterium]MYI76976.1 hypothetical protein [Gammaproteobacteria bacterium]